MTDRKTFLSIGECMIEMALLQSGDYRLGYAGDTLNTAWYARALMPAEDWNVAYFTRLGPDVYSAKMRRLEAKPKRKLKNPFGKARRGYEAIIEYDQAQLKAAWSGADAARAEADAWLCLASNRALEIECLRRELGRGV